jgi:hypothetical protein
MKNIRVLDDVINKKTEIIGRLKPTEGEWFAKVK